MTPPDPAADRGGKRRVAVILGSRGSGRVLLDLLQPLLRRDHDIEVQGVFVEEAEVQYAAELPFVQELCRVTFNVREFTSAQFEKALALRMRTARQALDVLARRTGVRHSFRSVRGPALGLLRETADRSDITVFEPVWSVGAGLTGATRRPHVVAVITDAQTGDEVMHTAGMLAGGGQQCLSTVLFPLKRLESGEVNNLARTFMGARPVQAVIDGDVGSLVSTVRGMGASLVVLPVTQELVDARVLRKLRDGLNCPVCLVRCEAPSQNQGD